MARKYSLLASVAAASLIAMAPFGTAQAESTNVTIKASLVKPLALTTKQDFDFGQVLLPLSGGAITIAVSQTGVRSCPAPASCSGTAKQAIFNVQGSNNQVVKITATATTLTNAAGNTLAFTPNAPSTVTLTNSGQPGVDFSVGGSISVSPTTPDGAYTGSMTVTADYQ